MLNLYILFYSYFPPSFISAHLFLHQLGLSSFYVDLKDRDSSGVLVSLLFPLFQPQLLTVKKLNAFVLYDCLTV